MTASSSRTGATDREVAAEQQTIKPYDGLLFDLTRDGDGATGSSAWLSADQTHRYRLGRTWSTAGPLVVWVMLNPSTADATLDDPTIRRCVAFSKREGARGLLVVNLFSLRATDPAELLRHSDPTGGIANAQSIADAASLAAEDGGLVVAAWGAHKLAAARAEEVAELLPDGFHCLGTTKSGAPRHPLYVRGDAPLTRWYAR